MLRIILLAVLSSGPIETVSLQSQLCGVSRSSDMDSGPIDTMSLQSQLCGVSRSSDIDSCPIDTMSLKSQLCGVSHSSDMYLVDLAFGRRNALPF